MWNIMQTENYQITKRLLNNSMAKTKSKNCLSPENTHWEGVKCSSLIVQSGWLIIKNFNPKYVFIQVGQENGHSGIDLWHIKYQSVIHEVQGDICAKFDKIPSNPMLPVHWNSRSTEWTEKCYLKFCYYIPPVNTPICSVWWDYSFLIQACLCPRIMLLSSPYWCWVIQDQIGFACFDKLQHLPTFFTHNSQQKWARKSKTWAVFLGWFIKNE